MPRHTTESLILAIDIGTSSARTGLFDQSGRGLRRFNAAEQYSVRFGPDGRAELSPVDLLGAVTRARDRTLRRYHKLTARKRVPITKVAASSLWHGLLGLDQSLRPITSIYTWADSRAAGDARALRDKFSERRILDR